ncbi:phosphatase PAP2 family protein [Candidatus Kaiserbacteria bacterium]|nr:phosphatase PAP2 family protein [Candidatus Kaiserbacteria bacterium]
MTENLILLAFFFGGVLIYAVLDPRTNAIHDLQTRFDRLIPFIPQFTVPYLGLYLLVPVTVLLLLGTHFERNYIASLAVGMYTGAAVWYFVPTKMHRPRVSGNSFSEKLALLIYRGDPHANGCPSAHVFSSLISSYFLSLAFPTYALIAWGAGLLVAVSTMFIKRHQAIDVLSGILWAAGAILIAQYLIPA